MGHSQHTKASSSAARHASRLRPRICLRQGCGSVFQPTRWNQRYCPDGECRRLVRRWQAARRQRKHRAREENRQRHAQAERSRRERNRRQATPTPEPATSAASAVEIREQDSAWSRSKGYPEIFCDRPGCYEPPRESVRVPARYCSDACRQAVRRVCDRERKWLRRNTLAVRLRRRQEWRQADLPRPDGANRTPRDTAARPASSVVNYRPAGDGQVSYRAHKEHPP